MVELQAELRALENKLQNHAVVNDRVNMVKKRKNDITLSKMNNNLLTVR